MVHPDTKEPVRGKENESICRYHELTGTIFCDKVFIQKKNNIKSIVISFIALLIVLFIFSFTFEFSIGDMEGFVPLPSIDPNFYWIIVPISIGAGVLFNKILKNIYKSTG